MTPRSSKHFDVSIESADESTTMFVSGEFDLTKVAAFDEAAEKLTETRSLTIDLVAVTLIDSAALGAVLRLCRDGRQIGRTTKVHAPRPYQRKLFEVTGLAHLLDES